MRTVNPQKVEIRKKEILEAARYCFEKSGFHATTMAEICARAQISPGALYRYFSSKEEIIGAMCDEQHFRALSILRGTNERIETREDFARGTFEIVSNLVAAYCNKEHGAMAAELIAEAMRNPLFAQCAAGSYATYMNELKSLLESGQKIGAIDNNADLDEMAGILMATVDGMVLRAGFCNDLDQATITKWLLGVIGRYGDYELITNSNVLKLPNAKLGETGNDEK